MRSRIVIPVVLLLGFFQAAFAQIQLIQNGGFESTSATPWVLAGPGVGIATGPTANGGGAFDGAQYLTLGNYAGQSQGAYQTITFPTNLIGATLSLYYNTVSTDPNGDDYLYFDITDTNNVLLEQLAYTDSAFVTGGYVLYATNFVTFAGQNALSSFAGQTVNVYFYAQTDPTEGSLTSFDIDDVSLLVGTTANIPANDNFAAATPILSATVINDVNTTYASKEFGEPNHAGNAGGHSVWWTWTSMSVGTVTITTTGSVFNTLLGVYTGSSVNNLTAVASNNGVTRASGLASLKFNVGPGTTYYIALDGYNGESGNAVFNFAFSTDTTLPTVVISSPLNKAVVTNSSVLVKGTANDNVAVAVVEYTLANAGGTNTWQVANTTNQWTNWSATVTNLIPGTNLVTVEAFDTSSNLSKLVASLFNYEIPIPLTLANTGRGTISGATNGQLLNLGFPYTIVAKTNGGFAFTGWTSRGLFVTNAASLSFIMASNLSFTANFVDVQKPALTLNAPTVNQRWSNSLFQITGKTSDNVAVAAVYYQLGSDGWTLASPLNNSWSNWTAQVTLTPGTNIVRAYAVDTSTNFSPTNTTSFDYVLTAPLVVRTNGRGTVSPNDNNQLLAVGTDYSITAAAAAGFAFASWTGSFPTNKPKLTFQMASNLTLIANFVDVTKPTLSIVSPTANLRVSNAVFTVAGKAGDNVQVSNVFYQLNKTGWQPAQTLNGWTNWTTNVTLMPGPNVLQAYAQDTAGNNSLTTNQVTFLYIPSATLAVQTNGLGGITPVENGKLLAIGTNYTVTATAGNNWIFSNWVATGSENFVSNNPVLKFNMQSNLMLAANFAPNPFIPQQGTFNGLFLDTNDVTEAGSGFFTLTLTTSGSFTGKILTSGGSYSLPTTTKFDAGGQVEFAITTPRNTLTFNLQLNIADPSAQQLTGQVFDGARTNLLIADRAIFNATTNKAADYEGQYTLAIAGSDDPATSPGGAGYATLSINSAGLITMAGSLADGTAISQSVTLSKDGCWPFYAPYALPPAGNGGEMLSWITFSNQPASALGGTMYWFRPGGKAPALYQSGFTNLMVPVTGSTYIPTAQPILALTSAQVTLTGGNLPFNIANQITLSPNNTITVPATTQNTNKLKLTITSKTGVISGSFQNPTNVKQTITINGVLLQNQTNAQGWFLGPNQSGLFMLENP